MFPIVAQWGSFGVAASDRSCYAPVASSVEEDERWPLDDSMR
jgi:hypothetical protein